MSEIRTHRRFGRRDSGMTLVEILVVVGMLGILASTLAAVFSFVLRATPNAEDRVTNARSLKGVVTWLPQDMDAVPPGDIATTTGVEGFDVDPTTWRCDGSAPADSHNVVGMTWSEVGASTTTFHASYRYELAGTEWRLVRYACENAGTARRLNMTSELPDWNTSAPPTSVEMCSTTVDTSGDCPALSVVGDPTSEPVESLKMTLTLLDGTEYTIDAAAKNPDENLADDPNANTNFPPTSTLSTYTLIMLAGDTAVLDLNSTHGISDPEGDFLTAARDSFEPMPSGITLSTADPLLATIEAESTLTAGSLSDPLVLIVSDAYGGAIEVSVEILIVEPPNNPPSVTTPSMSLQIGQGETMLLPIDLTHGASDPDGDSLSLGNVSWPATLANKPQVQSDDPALGDLEMSVTAKASVAIGTTDTITVRIFDEHGAFVDASIDLEVVAPSANSAPTVTTTDVPVSMDAGDTALVDILADHVAVDDPADLMWVRLDPAGTVPSGLEVTASGNEITVESDLTMVEGLAGSISLLITDWHGATTSVTVTVTIQPPPPPVSNCVLGSLALSQTSVARSGNGNGARVIEDDISVTLNYSGSCDGLAVKYDTGHPSGLGTGVGRVFPTGSLTTISLVGVDNGGTEKWTAGAHVLTASTTTDVTPNTVSITLNVT